MDLDIYQKRARITAIYPEKHKLVYPVLGLNGEAGEVAEKVKKYIRDNTSREDLVEDLEAELGDVLWYLSQVASDAGLSLNQIANANLHKLRRRQERGVLKGSGDHR